MSRTPDPNPATWLAESMEKRRTRPQLERAESQFLDLAPFRNADTEAAFAAVDSELSAVAEAMDTLDAAESYEKADLRQEADQAWEDLTGAVDDLKMVVGKSLGLPVDDEDDDYAI